MRIKNLYCVGETLYLFLEGGGQQIVTDPAKIVKYINYGLKFFKDNPNGVLEIDEDVNSLKYYDCNGVEIKYDPDNNSIKSIVTNNNSLILNMKSLSKYFAYSKKFGFLNGFNKFIQKITSNNHYQSMQDLTEFLQRNNLPLTQSGDILGFKVLIKNKNDKWVDSHTYLVEQNVGDRVRMDRDMVTLDKDIHCSYGLHVADFDYAYNFLRNDDEKGIFLVCVRVNNVVSVPNDTSSKIRVCEYDILYQLTDEDIELLRHEKFSDNFSKFIGENVRHFIPKRIVTLKKRKVRRPEDIEYKDCKKKNVEVTKIKNTKKSKNVHVTPVDDNEKIAQRTYRDFLIDLSTAIDYISKYNETGSLTQKEAKFIIDFYKRSKKTITWSDLNINNRMRTKIHRIAGVY